MKEQFLINERFEVNTVLNSLNDKQIGKETRLEQRLMDVLCILTANAEKLVTREQLIKAVWNDYGGADEGLNQAISFIRKVLADNNKKIIETIPKKGYILHAVVSTVEETSGRIKHDVPTIKPGKKFYWISGLLFVLILLVYFLYIKTSGSGQLQNNKETKSADVLTDSSKKTNYKSSDELNTGKGSADSTGADLQ